MSLANLYVDDLHSRTERGDLDAIIEIAEARLREEIDRRGINSARRADELAAQSAGELRVVHGFAEDSEEAEAITAALCRVAGDEFPGEWEDYPKE